MFLVKANGLGKPFLASLSSRLILRRPSMPSPSDADAATLSAIRLPSIPRNLIRLRLPVRARNNFGYGFRDNQKICLGSNPEETFVLTKKKIHDVDAQ